jgi:hypothetical protein
VGFRWSWRSLRCWFWQLRLRDVCLRCSQSDRSSVSVRWRSVHCDCGLSGGNVECGGALRDLSTEPMVAGCGLLSHGRWAAVTLRVSEVHVSSMRLSELVSEVALALSEIYMHTNPCYHFIGRNSIVYLSDKLVCQKLESKNYILRIQSSRVLVYPLYLLKLSICMLFTRRRLFQTILKQT